jgi:hypothetical protein
VAECLDLRQLGHGLLRRTPTPECSPGHERRVYPPFHLVRT